MTNVKLALVVVFLATFILFPMKKVEGCARTLCDVRNLYTGCGDDCGCLPWGIIGGNCMHNWLIKKAVKEHYNLCESHDDCIKKGSGSICAYYPNSQLQHGWCFTSNVEAEHYFEVLSNPAVKNFLDKITYSNEKEFSKVAPDIVT